jgi:hypothetical protein
LNFCRELRGSLFIIYIILYPTFNRTEFSRKVVRIKADEILALYSDEFDWSIIYMTRILGSECKTE